MIQIGMSDSQSVNIEEDLVPSDSVFPETVSETLQVFRNPDHRWYLKDRPSIGEMLLFKIFGSDETVARCIWTN